MKPAALALTVALAVIGVLPALLHPGHVAGDGVDAWGTFWFYWWIRTCVEHLGNPGWTPLFFWPLGKDVLAHTGNNFVDALWSVPFQWSFGPTLYQPLFLVVVQVGNAMAFRPLAREVLGEEAVLPASLLWMCNPYLVFEIAAGRPTQAFLWWVPPAVLLFLRVLRDGRLRDGAWLGVAVAVTGWTYWFEAFFLCFLLALLWRPRGTRALLLGVGVCALLVLPAVGWMASAWQAGRIPGQGAADDGGLLDLPRYVGNNVNAELHGLQLMETQGVALTTNAAWLLGLAVASVRARIDRRWWLAWLGLVVLALGPAVHVGDRTVVLPWYMALYRHLPFFDRLWFPYRIAGLAFLPAVLLVVAAWRRSALLLLPLSLFGSWRADVWPFPIRDARCPEVLRALADEPRAGVLFLPMRIQHEGLLWQTVFQLPTYGGMGESAPALWPPGWKERQDERFVRELRTAAVRPERAAVADAAAFRADGFRWIVLRRDLVEGEQRRTRGRASVDAVTAKIAEIVGHPPDAVDGALLVWDVAGRWTPPEALRATPEHLAAATWTPPPP